MNVLYREAEARIGQVGPGAGSRGPGSAARDARPETAGPAAGIERSMATIERLKRRPDFLAAAAGRRFHTDRMTAQGRLRGGEAGGLRLGFTVTKRVGHATERNRIKRRLRAAVAEVAAGLPSDLAVCPADIVLIARRPALDAAFATLADDLRQAIPSVTRPGRQGAGASGGRPHSSRRGGRPSAPPAPQNERVGVPDGQ